MTNHHQSYPSLHEFSTVNSERHLLTNSLLWKSLSSDVAAPFKNSRILLGAVCPTNWAGNLDTAQQNYMNDFLQENNTGTYINLQIISFKGMFVCTVIKIFPMHAAARNVQQFKTNILISYDTSTWLIWKQVYILVLICMRNQRKVKN